MDYQYTAKAIEEDILRSLDNCNPIIDYFNILEKKYDFIFKKELVSKQIYYFKVSEPQTMLIGDGENIPCGDIDKLYNQINLQYKEVPLYPIIVSELFSETLFYSKRYITPQFKFCNEDIVRLFNSTLERKIVLTNSPESTLIVSTPQVSVSHDISSMGVHVSIRQNIGVVLSTVVVDKLKNRWCGNCNRRLKCALIPEKLCNLSWMVSQ
jgi:hypothetical protein